MTPKGFKLQTQNNFCFLHRTIHHDQIISNNLNEKSYPFCCRAYAIAFGCWSSGGTWKLWIFWQTISNSPNLYHFTKIPWFLLFKPYIIEPLDHDQIISNNLNLKRNPFCYRAYTIAFGCWAWAHGNGGIFGRQVQGLSLWQNKRWQHFDAHSCPERTSRYCNGPFQKGRVIYAKYYKFTWLFGLDIIDCRCLAIFIPKKYILRSKLTGLSQFYVNQLF